MCSRRPRPGRICKTANAIGNSRFFPFTKRNHKNKLGVDVSVKDGGGQVEFEDQDPRIHRMFLEALAANGVECRMTEFPVKAAE